MAETILKMHGIQKYFPGVHALDDIHLELHAGEVLALIGENGAGKSTLMKILTGIYTKDEGTIELFGKPVEITSPKNSQNMGISIVHQELNLMQDLTVAENIFIGREPVNGCFLNQKKQVKMAAELLKSLNLRITANDLVKTLSVAQQQMVEIAKALSYNNTRVLIMDEPSAALTTSEIEELFIFIRRLKATGVGIIYISHRMDELKEITDRVTVMRDGQYVDTVSTAETPIEDVVKMMVGRVIYEEPKTCSNVPDNAPVILEVSNLSAPMVKDVSFQLHKGEILGFSGLMGAGRTETMRLICGADKRDAGVIKVNGKELSMRSPQAGVNAGIGYLSEDRKHYGLCLGLSVAENTVLPTLDAVCSGPFISPPKISKYAKEYVEKIRVKTASIHSLVRTLSGGNQQKIVIAKWLMRDCDILIFDEPTRGIDVGAKSEIYKLMNQLVAEGKSIIMISSELPELLRMSDRVIVMCEGRITGELDIAVATQENIMTYATSR